uniref:Putative polyprotein n=1 Tax=Albugo laibachii Nc14 TaxID=890382 RepID=F0W407_9STRA|nr:putative polyprotein [Albugo laibachii Nc14]|eukprot:CCA15804.1 putative polyprotein [Albugo laibachii Nc14]
MHGKHSVPCANFGQSTEVTSSVLSSVDASLSDISRIQCLSKNGGIDHSSEVLNVLPSIHDTTKTVRLRFNNPPRSYVELTNLSCIKWRDFLHEQNNDSVKQVCNITCDPTSQYLNATQELSSRGQHFEVQSMDKLQWDNNPVYSLLLEFADIFPLAIPVEFPKERGIRGESDLMLRTKYFTTRQWPLPRDQVEAIDSFFAKRQKGGHVRESISSHSTPTFCVKWRQMNGLSFTLLTNLTMRPSQLKHQYQGKMWYWTQCRKYNFQRHQFN